MVIPQKIFDEIKKDIKPPFKWTSVTVGEIIKENNRIEANTFGIEGRQVRNYLKSCKWPIDKLGNQFIKNIYYLGRFKRIYVDSKNGIPFILPSQITELNPKAIKFISPLTNIDINSTKATRDQILVTRSGTVGIVSFVNKALLNKSLSDDIIHIDAKEYPGYVYCYLKSKTGFTLINTNYYGSIINHIEPEHLENIPIPNPSPIIKQKINDLIKESYNLRNESNELIESAQELLRISLKLPDIEILKENVKKFDINTRLLNFTIPLNKINNRLDASYHIPIVDLISDYIKKNSVKVINIGDEKISKKIIIPGRFKRTYITEGNGAVFFGGKQIYELDPSNKKYLSITHHEKRIKNQLILHKNMILITCSGTIGKVTIVPGHWEGWTANQHIIRVVPINDNIAGYLYAWLSSNYAFYFITRYTYGAVVDEIDNNQVAQIEIPLLENEKIQTKINDMILEANEKRTEAYHLEQKALRILDEMVIFAK